MDTDRVISTNVCGSILSLIPADSSLVNQQDEEVPEGEAQTGKKTW